MPVVYIDLLFLINFMLDAAVLYCTSLFLKRTISFLRLCLTAAILALYSTVMFFPQVRPLYSLAGKILILLISVRLAFPVRNFFILLKNTAVFFSINAIVGGVMYALIFTTDFGTKVGAAVSNGEIYLNISASTIFLSSIPAFSAAFVISHIRKQHEKLAVRLSSIKIEFNNKVLSCNAFADTGCNLCEPISGRAAVIISQSFAKRLLGCVDFSSNNTLPPDKFCILPYTTIGEKSGVLSGFYPDSIEIDDIPVHAVLAIAKQQLCPNRQYDAIYNPDILEGLQYSSTMVNERI